MALFTVGMLSLGFSPLNVHAEEDPITTTVISPAWNDDGSLKTDEAFAKPGYLQEKLKKPTRALRL